MSQTAIFKDEFSEEVWKTTYKHHADTSVADTFRRVAKAVASAESSKALREEWEEKFFDMLSDFKVTCGGRIYSNAGTEFHGTTLMNCFVGPKPEYDQDSLDGIIKTLLYQAKTLKSEGGWGMNFSFIRPRGSFIHGIGVETPGAVKYMELFDKTSDIITAGSGLTAKNAKAKGKIRKGAMMGVLWCWHPDIQEFVDAKLTEGRLAKFNISVGCSDEFMDKVVSLKDAEARGDKEFVLENDKWELVFPETTHERYKAEWDGDIEFWKSKGYPVEVKKIVSALGLWEQIMKSTYTRNDPGVLFLDKANQTHCWNYGGQASRIHATNPCQPGWAPILTKNGIVKLKDVDVGSEVWSIDGWTTVLKKWSTGVKPVYRYNTTSGTFYGTKNHRVVSEGVKIEAHLAESIDQLVGPHHPVYDHNAQDIMDGMVLGDGSVHGASNNLIYLCVGEDDQDYHTSEVSHLIKCHRPGITSHAWEINTTISVNELPYTYLRSIPERFLYASPAKASAFLRGLYTANGSVVAERVTLKAASFKVIEQVQMMLSALGIRSYYTTNKPTRVQFSNGDYECKESYDLNITKDRQRFLFLVGFVQGYKNTKLVEVMARTKPSSRTKISYDIVSVDQVSEEEVFDITVDNPSHTYWTGGVNVSNCGEQGLPFASVCNLASVNLTQFINDKRTGFDLDKVAKYVSYAVRFLDDVNDYTNAPLEQYAESIKNRRRIGLGVMGWGSALYILNVPFASDKAEQMKKKLMQTFTTAAIETSIELAKEKGMFRDCEPLKHADVLFWKQIKLDETLVNKIRKYGIRNSALFSIQPTGNTSILANIVSGGLEPVFMPEYTRTVIVPICPDSLKPKVPKYWEGEFKETEFFKMTKEGADEILRAVIDGIVYKIDKNRGLTKEVPCIDYGVRILKESGNWDVKADWAKTALSLSVEDHVKDMVGWGKWIDSSMSKTVNCPSDYPYDKFENLYLDAYKSGFLKGITTYRAGTMTTVLSEKTETKEEATDRVKKTRAPKRPSSLPCSVEHMTIKGHRFYAIVGMLGGDPYEVFAGSNHDSDGEPVIPKGVDHGEIVKAARGNYRLKAQDKEFLFSASNTDASVDALTRMISTSLRHGADISFVVHQLEKTKGDMLSFAKVLSRALKKSIKNGAPVYGESCPSCNGHHLVREDGCVTCKDCGWTKCA